MDTRCAHVQVFVETMGCDPACLMNCDPKEDFGGPDSAHHGHADPNLAHARALCDRMCVAKDGAPVDGGDPPSFGAAADGDAVCVAVDAEKCVWTHACRHTHPARTCAYDSTGTRRIAT